MVRRQLGAQSAAIVIRIRFAAFIALRMASTARAEGPKGLSLESSLISCERALQSRQA
jgi:hypothetical protein